MANNSNLKSAKDAKNDEFYTQFCDIESEMNSYVEYNPDVFRDKTILLPCDDPEWSNFTKYFASNFERFGLKKLISTSYAKGAGNKQVTIFELESPNYDADKHETHGKLFTLTRDTDGSGRVDLDDIEFNGYLEGDGDFRSEEVTNLRNEADFIITNPPFSLFREFLDWILEADKRFIILGNMNAITYAEVFPLLMNNQIWIGNKRFSGGMDMIYPSSDFDATKVSKYRVDESGNYIVNIMGVIWFTNVDLYKRHEEMRLDTMAHNLKFNQQLKKKFIEQYESSTYPCFDNYDAIEVPFVECIPSDYYGVMGVPVTFLEKHNPNQFEILGITDRNNKYGLTTKIYTKDDDSSFSDFNRRAAIRLPDGSLKGTYARLLIRRKEQKQ
ncbi:MAG: adenine-specific methyltransferase EcoRI family protein [Saccharofermentans sp.]|nr:adenine-specific methyltransferase EcoRI family protein [Saccharofermentans sp.]